MNLRSDAQSGTRERFSLEASPRRSLPAWALSSLLHALALWVLAAISGRGAVGTLAEPERAVGIALVTPDRPQTRYLDENGAQFHQAPGGEATRASAFESVPGVVDALPDARHLPVAPHGELPHLDQAMGLGDAMLAAASLPDAGQMTQGPVPGRAVGLGTASTYVFGVEGRGSVFVYVFDRSDSMNAFEGRPLAAAKAELLKSLRSLSSTQQFQVFFYNRDVAVFNPNPGQPARLMFADEGNQRLAEQFVRGVRAFGGTEHTAPLRTALRLAPDVIFLLTDAADPQLTGNQLDELHRLNSGTVIHAIEFGVGPFPGGDNFLVQLARQNDGRHTYVDVTQLPGR